MAKEFMLPHAPLEKGFAWIWLTLMVPSALAVAATPGSPHDTCGTVQDGRHVRTNLTLPCEEPRRRLLADPDLEPGFPVQAIHTAGSYVGGPGVCTVVGDMDGDGTLEILVSALATGPLYAWHWDGAPVSGWPLGGGVGGAGYPAMAELSTPSAGLEVASGHYGTPGQIAAYSWKGVSLTGWPRNSSNYIASPPALADVDGDGLDEMFVGEEDGRLHAYRADGSVLSGWPRYEALGGQERHTPAIGDLDGDGDLEIVAASDATTPGVYLFAYHHTGTAMSGFPVLFPDSGYAHTFPAIGDVTGDGVPEVIVIAREPGWPWRPMVNLVTPAGAVAASWTLTGFSPYGTAPALADLDGDTVPEILVQTDTTLEACRGNGTPLSGWPVSLSGSWQGASAPVVGDVDGDGLPDIVITTQVVASSTDGEVRVYDRNGVPHSKFPKTLAIGAGAVPAIADLDGDKRNEIIVTGSYWGGLTGSYDKVWVYDLGGSEYGPIQWGQMGGSPQHQGAMDSRVVLRMAGENLSWSGPRAATAYDLVRGDLETLLSTGGDFASATGECVADDLPIRSLSYVPAPPAGGAYWFLVRAVTPTGHGTYDEGGEVAPRDAGIGASPHACP